MCAEMIASKTFERLQVLNLENQLLAAVPCTFLDLCFPMNFAFLVLSTAWWCAYWCPFFMCEMFVFLPLLGVGMRWASLWRILALVLTGV